MYTYKWDSTTGGYLLTKTASKFSKEPRPVYYKELDILGFDKHWIYEKQENVPYMWAESSQYIHRGRVVAKIIGGSLYNPPQLEVYEEGLSLRPIDLNVMVEKNTEVMESLVNDTIKNVYSTYLAYKRKIDVFYVAFSGGKDSIVLLDIIQRALPHDEFLVVFGDTDMECKDTYRVRNEIEKFNGYEDIRFYTAKSHLKSTDTWNIFGPPARKLRWCCSVHKTTPQINLLRKLLNKPSFKGMAFIGVRKDESMARSEYDTINIGKKHEGQYSMNAIDNWNTAELYLYIYKNKLLINEAYKKGMSRVGCLICPMSSGKHEFLKEINYPKQVLNFLNIVREKNNRKFDDIQKENEFINNGGWKSRNNGRDIKVKVGFYDEISSKDVTKIYIKPNSEWEIWFRTLGELVQVSESEYYVLNNRKKFSFTVIYENNLQKIEWKTTPKTKEDILFVSSFKIVFKKTAYCVKCGVCQANCNLGYIHMDDQFSIDNKCIKCRKCHNIDSGCLVYNSVKILKGVENKMSLDCYASFGVEKDWITKYLKHKELFWSSEYNDLGSMKITALKRFLRDANIKLEKDNYQNSESLPIIMNNTINRLGYDNIASWTLLLCNLVYTPQFNWFVKNLFLNERYIPEQIKEMLGDKYSKGSKDNIVSSIKNIFTKTPFGTDIKLVHCETKKIGRNESLISITRTSWKNPDPKVILYGLYKFAEACGDYYQFSLNRLLNHEIDSDGVSPTLIFGLDKDTMTKLLTGLSVNYPEFIKVGFTHDLDNITLSGDKKSTDVLELF